MLCFCPRGAPQRPTLFEALGTCSRLQPSYDHPRRCPSFFAGIPRFSPIAHVFSSDLENVPQNSFASQGSLKPIMSLTSQGMSKMGSYFSPTVRMRMLGPTMSSSADDAEHKRCSESSAPALRITAYIGPRWQHESR